jgi:hypothetical protein
MFSITCDHLAERACCYVRVKRALKAAASS